MNKNVLAIGIVFLFVCSAFIPMSLGYNVKTIQQHPVSNNRNDLNNNDIGDFNGSFILIDYRNDNNVLYHDVCIDGSNIYTACDEDGIRAYTFDGKKLLNIAHQDDSTDRYSGLWNDGVYIYTACFADGIRAYTFDGNNFSHIDHRDDGGLYRNIWGDGTYIYVANSGEGVRAYTFDGNNFVLKGSRFDGTDPWNTGYFDVTGDGNYIYTACNVDGIRAYTFDGNNFHLLNTYCNGNSYRTVYCNDSYIYAGDRGFKIEVLTFDGENFALITNHTGNIDDIFSDSTFIFSVGANQGGICAYYLENNILKRINKQVDFKAIVGIDGDNNYLYAACDEDGIAAYKFNAYSPNTPQISGPCRLRINRVGTFSISTIDYDGDQIYFYIDWGDGNTVDWDGPYNSSEIVNFNHKWTFENKYLIKVKARDAFDAESDWAEFEITITRNRATYNSLFLRFLEQFPILQKILNLII